MQPATYIFKLRRNIDLEGDLALARCELEAFVCGVVSAVADLSALVRDFPCLRQLGQLAVLEAFARGSGTVAYRAEAPLSLLPELIRRLSFVQSIYCLTHDTRVAKALVVELPLVVGPVFDYRVSDVNLVIHAIPHYALCEFSDVVARRSTNASETRRNLSLLLDALLGRSIEPRAVRLAEVALAAQSTTSHLSHDLHYYKAKFFPRLVRSLLNVCAQRSGTRPHRVLDPFVGSGTTLLEAATLGLPSVGLDIDPLSALITRTKLGVLQIPAAVLTDEVKRALSVLGYEATSSWRCGTRGAHNGRELTDTSTGRLHFPQWLMKNRRMNAEIASALSKEIQPIRTVIATADPSVGDLFRVHLSDAISRHVRMRLLGTGVGRFALTFSHTPLTQIFANSLNDYVKVAATAEWLRETLHLRLADAEAVVGDARRIPDGLGQFDILVTSPPYLPASSGRESYAKARALSLIALGMRDHEDVDDLVDDAVGSMDGDGADLEALTARERAIVEWLCADELRAIKAEPTARYFLDMRQAFGEMRRVLVPGALAVVVSGKQSTFYQFSTRQPLLVVPAAELLAEEAHRCGFEVEELQDIQLRKTNRNARPRSLDDYYETLIVLRNPG